jgi:hypothetical protein
MVFMPHAGQRTWTTGGGLAAAEAGAGWAEGAGEAIAAGTGAAGGANIGCGAGATGAA